MREYKKIKIETEGGREMKRLNLIILIILALIITVSLFACNSADKKTPKKVVHGRSGKRNVCGKY